MLRHTQRGEILARRRTVACRPDLHQPDVLFPRGARQLDAVVNLLRIAVRVEANPPREERHDGDSASAPEVEAARFKAGEVEIRRALEEESPLLRKEQRVLGEVDLPLIDLGLREVGVDRDVRTQRGVTL